MTFFAPEFEGLPTSASFFSPTQSLSMGSLGVFSAMTPAASLQALEQIGDMQMKLMESMAALMLLPFAGFVPGAALPDTPPDQDVAVEPAAEPALPALLATVAPVANDDVASLAPALFDAPDGQPDDLLLIKGIGPKLNQLLNALGIWHYRQIVSWTPAEVAWVNAKIDFKGRIQRERWQVQAAELMKAAKAA